MPRTRVISRSKPLQLDPLRPQISSLSSSKKSTTALGHHDPKGVVHPYEENEAVLQRRGNGALGRGTNISPEPSCISKTVADCPPLLEHENTTRQADITFLYSAERPVPTHRNRRGTKPSAARKHTEQTESQPDSASRWATDSAETADNVLLYPRSTDSNMTRYTHGPKENFSEKETVSLKRDTIHERKGPKSNRGCSVPHDSTRTSSNLWNSPGSHSPPRLQCGDINTSQRRTDRRSRVCKNGLHIRDYGIGLYFVRVLRETQNERRPEYKRTSEETDREAIEARPYHHQPLQEHTVVEGEYVQIPAVYSSEHISLSQQGDGNDVTATSCVRGSLDKVGEMGPKVSCNTTTSCVASTPLVSDQKAASTSKRKKPTVRSLPPRDRVSYEQCAILSSEAAPPWAHDGQRADKECLPENRSENSSPAESHTGATHSYAAAVAKHSPSPPPVNEVRAIDTTGQINSSAADDGETVCKTRVTRKRRRRKRPRRLAMESEFSEVAGASQVEHAGGLSDLAVLPSSTDSTLWLPGDAADTDVVELPHTSTPSPSSEPLIDSKTTSAERLRICSSPNFVYDPEIASQIPFYFTEPSPEDCDIFPVIFQPIFYTPVSDDGDSSSSCSWSEFDVDLRNCGEVRGNIVRSDVTECCDDTTGVHSRDGEPEPTEESLHSDGVLTDDSVTTVSEELYDDLEIDYDTYLPAHVLMHVKRDLVSVLMEYGQTREVKVTFTEMQRTGPHHASRFHTAAIVDGETFRMGSSSSKKNAKKAAAAHSLKTMYERGRANLEFVNEVAHQKLLAMSEEEVGSHAHRVVMVSRHVLDTAEETQFINYSKDKIAATFVLEYQGKMRVVGLGTGNRCILYQHMTLDGKRIIHSHAEIMARRAFIRYLYKQLLTFNANRSHPIFTRSTDTGKLRLRDKIQVHLYISRPPCGDAAAFPTISNFPNKMRAIRKQGQLRTIIDDGEGAIPTDSEVPAGASGKERLRIMTCSDKICRWNVLGVQGALLSHFLDPIYINTLVIGSHMGDQQGHVPRAVSGRLKCGRLHEVIQRPYRINTADIHYPPVDLADNYNISKSKQYCITWSHGDPDAEVIDAITGATNMEAQEQEEVIPSRVSKSSLFSLFQQVCAKYHRPDLTALTYVKAKKSATSFQRMKTFVGQHLAAMGFGPWYSLQETYGTDNFPSAGGPC